MRWNKKGQEEARSQAVAAPKVAREKAANGGPKQQERTNGQSGEGKQQAEEERSEAAGTGKMACYMERRGEEQKVRAHPQANTRPANPAVT